MHIGSAMTENVPEANTEYAEVAKAYEEDVLVVYVPESLSIDVMNHVRLCFVYMCAKSSLHMLHAYRFSDDRERARSKLGIRGGG